jgi:hypothetical protein
MENMVWNWPKNAADAKLIVDCALIGGKATRWGLVISLSYSYLDAAGVLKFNNQ